MAEVQTTTESGEMAQRFIEFVMMHAQNAALFLGQIPNPHSGKGEINLPIAKMFIDQLVMIRSKTRGNLSEDELKVLNNAISNLQMVFVEVSQKQGQEAGNEPAGESVATGHGDGACQCGTNECGGEHKEEGDEPKKKFSKTY